MMKTNPLEAICASERAYAAIPYVETGNNHQCFSDVVNAAGLAGCQNQAWCATYQFAVEIAMVGVDQALKNWNMTRTNYCGYSCFETETMFKAAGKTGSTPKVGALVIFKQSHMGRVLSVSGNTFECGEGNTSNAKFDRNGDSCAVKTYSVSDPKIKSFCYIDYKAVEMTPQDIIASCRDVYQMAHNGKWKYGDSHALPPCIADKTISCDRLVALALYRLGFTQQPAGGITVLNMESYLTKWGFKKASPNNALKPGDIVLMKQNGTTAPTAAWHTFVVVDVVVSGGLTMIHKYDMGSQERINAAQPFFTPVNQWSDKTVYCYFRLASTNYSFTPSELVAGSKNNSAYLATEILKARGFKGIYKDGKQQDLELNFEWSIGDMAAACQCVADRMKRGNRTVVTAGYVNKELWRDLLGMYPFVCAELPTQEKKGLSVLLCQEILKARGINGADGKPLALDREWGDNTEYAVKQYQTARHLDPTGVVDYKTWHDMVAL